MRQARLTPKIVADIEAAQTLYTEGRYDEAEPLIRRIIRKGFGEPLTYDALGTVAQQQGNLPLAIDCYRTALGIDPNYREGRERLIMMLDVMPDTTATQAQRERDRWWQTFGAPIYAKWARPHDNDRDPERPLRVGYFSGDFEFHSAESVFSRVALAHSPAVQPFFYSSTPHKKLDAVTDGYRSLPGWRDVWRWPDSMLAGKVRADRIDIAVDLSGYTNNNRLVTFAHKPAPIQVTAWGYATGVGWPAMDYLGADPVVIPPDRRGEHVERILDLPCVISYDRRYDIPEPDALPCLTQPPTFGVFQRSMKFNQPFLDLCVRILQRVPDSRLLLKGDFPASMRQRIEAGLAPIVERVQFLGHTTSHEHMAAYRHLDLSLDTFPQTGGVTTCEALWQGVPCVTLLGPRVIQRASASILTCLGLTDFIAQTPDEYVDRAVEWVTTRKQELAGLRLGMRERFKASPVHDGYVEAVEKLYRAAWQEWCAKPLTLADAQYRMAQAMAS